MTELPRSVNHERFKVLIIVAIAVVPLIVASVMFFFFPGMVPGMTTNQGTLIQPPVQIEVSGLVPEGKWVMLIMVNGQCDNVCEQVLYVSRQVHISLGKDASRIQRIIITAEALSVDFMDLLAREYGNVEIVDASHGATSILRNLLTDARDGTVIFIMDPNGNIMMYYRSSQVGKPLRDDLKHLLKVSNIG